MCVADFIYIYIHTTTPMSTNEYKKYLAISILVTLLSIFVAGCTIHQSRNQKATNSIKMQMLNDTVTKYRTHYNIQSAKTIAHETNEDNLLATLCEYERALSSRDSSIISLKASLKHYHHHPTQTISVHSTFTDSTTKLSTPLTSDTLNFTHPHSYYAISLIQNAPRTSLTLSKVSFQTSLTVSLSKQGEAIVVADNPYVDITSIQYLKAKSVNESRRFNIGIYGGPMVGYSPIHRDIDMVIGIGCGIIYNL